MASILARHRRLLALGCVSLALHLLALAWIAGRGAFTRPQHGGTPLAVRLARPAPAAPAAAAPATPAPRTPRARGAAVPVPLAQPAARGPAAVGSWAAVAGGQDEDAAQMPGRYRVRLPPPARLSYAVTQSRPGEQPAAAGSALIEWQAGIDSYSLRMDGVAGVLRSSGGVGDAGILPSNASETLADGASVETSFDQTARRIAFSRSPQSYRLAEGSQDRASMLMQLAGMGLAEPDQMRGVIEIFVGGAADAGIVRFQVAGTEEIDSPLGMLAAWHLVQLAAPGQTRLELWLAPRHNWYPVQLRTTGADGTVSTQLVTRIEGAR